MVGFAVYCIRFMATYGIPHNLVYIDIYFSSINVGISINATSSNIYILSPGF